MYGPSLEHVDECSELYRDKLIDGGLVDFLVGAAPGNGDFVLGFSEDPFRRDYLKYLKMGDGPLYVFLHTVPFATPRGSPDGRPSGIAGRSDSDPRRSAVMRHHRNGEEGSESGRSARWIGGIHVSWPD